MSKGMSYQARLLNSYLIDKVHLCHNPCLSIRPYLGENDVKLSYPISIHLHISLLKLCIYAKYCSLNAFHHISMVSAYPLDLFARDRCKTSINSTIDSHQTIVSASTHTNISKKGYICRKIDLQMHFTSLLWSLLIRLIFLLEIDIKLLLP